MNILVTGCHGFVGHNLCKALLAQGHKVTGTDRLVNAISDKAARVRQIAKAGLEYVEANLADYRQAAAILSARRFDVVFHLAAQFPIPHNRRALGQYINSNVTAFANVLEASKEYRVKRLVYSSSITARTNGKPSSMYGATKRFGEEMAHVYSRMGLECAVLRLGAVYGPLMRVDAGLWKVANLVLSGRRLPMMTGFRSKHEMVFIDDVAGCMAAFAGATLPERYILETVAAHDYAADFGDAAGIIGKLSGRKPILPVGYERRPRERMCDMSALEKLCGMVPATTLDKGLARLVEHIG